MKPKWQELASLAQEIGTLWFQFFGAVFASKGYPFKNIFLTRFLILPAYSFTLTSNIPISTSTGGLDSIVFSITSCDVVFVSLKGPDPLTSYVLIEMVPWNAHAHYCTPDCVEENSVQASLGPDGSFECSSDEQTYWLVNKIIQ